MDSHLTQAERAALADAMRGRLLFQWCPAGVSQAPALVPFVERRWAVTATARNARTLAELVRLVGCRLPGSD